MVLPLKNLSLKIYLLTKQKYPALPKQCGVFFLTFCTIGSIIQLLIPRRDNDMRRMAIIILVLAMLSTGCSSQSKETSYTLKNDYNKLLNEFNVLSKNYDDLKDEYDTFKLKNDDNNKVSNNDLGITLLSGWGISIFGNADCTEIDDRTVQIMAKLSDTSDMNIEIYYDRFIEELPKLATMYSSPVSSDYLDYDAIFIKVVSQDLQPIIEYVVYPKKNSTDFMISTQFADVLEKLVD